MAFGDDDAMDDELIWQLQMGATSHIPGAVSRPAAPTSPFLSWGADLGAALGRAAGAIDSLADRPAEPRAGSFDFTEWAEPPPQPPPPPPSWLTAASAPAAGARNPGLLEQGGGGGGRGGGGGGGGGGGEEPIWRLQVAGDRGGAWGASGGFPAPAPPAGRGAGAPASSSAAARAPGSARAPAPPPPSNSEAGFSVDMGGDGGEDGEDDVEEEEEEDDDDDDDDEEGGLEGGGGAAQRRGSSGSLGVGRRRRSGTGLTQEEARNRRLERNRQSARLSRRRKKDYLHLLESRLLCVQHDLNRARVEHACAATADLDAQRAMLLAAMEPMVHLKAHTLEQEAELEGACEALRAAPPSRSRRRPRTLMSPPHPLFPSLPFPPRPHPPLRCRQPAR